MNEFAGADERALGSRFCRTIMIACLPFALFLNGCQNTEEQTFEERKSQVLKTGGLIAFWDFEPETEGPMINLVELEHAYPIYIQANWESAKLYRCKLALSR